MAIHSTYIGLFGALGKQALPPTLQVGGRNRTIEAFRFRAKGCIMNPPTPSTEYYADCNTIIHWGDIHY